MNLDDLPPTLAIEEAGRLLGLGRSSAYRAARRGELPTLQFGRRLVVPTMRLLRLLGAEPENEQDGDPHKEDGAAV